MNDANLPAHWFLEPFAELRTMPAQWDLSEILSPADRQPGSQACLPEAVPPDHAQTISQETAETPALPQWPLDPSAGLHTTPAHWDLTGLL